MNKLFLGTLLALAAIANLPCRVRAQMGTENGAGGRVHAGAFVPRFHAAFDVLQFKADSSGDSTRIDLYLAVPYAALQFLYNGRSYIAEYSASVRISHAGTVVRDLFTSYSVTEPASEHHANGIARADAEQLSFHLPPGSNYRFQLTLHDSYANRDFDTSFAYSVNQFRNGKAGMSDLLLYRDRTGMNIIPSIGPDVSSLEARASATPPLKDNGGGNGTSNGVFAELYNMLANTTLGIVTEAMPEDSLTGAGTIGLRTTSVVHVPDATGSSRTFTAPEKGATVATTPLFMPLNVRNLWLGTYRLRTYVLPSVMDTNVSDPAELARRAIATASRTIRVGIAPGIPISINDLDQAIEQLRIIATSTEWDSLSNAKTPREKRDAILDFWLQKKFSTGESGGNAYGATGNRAMEVFYSRIAYANEHFSTGFGQGWRSDRGHMYIALGAPDNIEDNPQAYSQSFGGMQRAYQVWQYTERGISYVFVDDYGMGDYRLRGVFPPEGTFEW